MTDGPQIRHAVRVLLIDEDERLLLIRFESSESGGAFWIAPGGGIERGEDARTAARREVAEETGLCDLDPGPEVFRRRTSYVFRGVRYDQRERWFLARVAAFDPVPTQLTDDEREGITAWRWWSLDALQASDERRFPPDLVARIRGLLAGGLG